MGHVVSSARSPDVAGKTDKLRARNYLFRIEKINQGLNKLIPVYFAYF